jgi:short subunit dehydrogenase-like uncharacterized protein
MKTMIDDVRADRSLMKVLGDPYALSPDREAEPDLGDESDMTTPEQDEELGGWLAPFVMARINTRVVRRSNALQDWGYGRRFKYREVMATGDGLGGRSRALAVATGLGALAGGLALPPTRFVLDRVLPDPGEGPKDDLVYNGFYRIEIHARAAGTGERWICRVEAQGDPGYGATRVMLAEAGLCLALDQERLPDRAGVLTPSTAMGDALVERLRAAGQTFEVERA